MIWTFVYSFCVEIHFNFFWIYTKEYNFWVILLTLYLTLWGMTILFLNWLCYFPFITAMFKGSNFFISICSCPFFNWRHSDERDPLVCLTLRSLHIGLLVWGLHLFQKGPPVSSVFIGNSINYLENCISYTQWHSHSAILAFRIAVNSLSSEWSKDVIGRFKENK